MSLVESPSEFAASISEAADAQRIVELVADEALVILVCLIGFLLGRKFFFSKKTCKDKTDACWQQQVCNSSVPTAMREKKLFDTSLRRSKPTLISDRAPLATLQPIMLPQIQSIEQQIMKLLNQREFTRALNMFRACERDGRDRHFVSEAFFVNFIQSAVRVGKIDVVERFWRIMRQNGVQPTVTSWNTMLRMLSSRKHFSTVVVAYEVFDKRLPADKVIYSCLINAALECEQAPMAAHMLEGYNEVDLSAKDYILHFRTYAALKDADLAEALLRKLLLERGATTLMLNLTLLAFANGGQPRRAATLLSDIEDGDVRLADAVSYNTLIKGFVQIGDAKRCLECLQEMRAHGTEPDDVTISSLVDVCTAEGNSEASTSLVHILSSGGASLDTSTCALFIRGLVRAGSLPKALQLLESQKVRQQEGPRNHFNLSTYSILIKACVDSHDLERALQLFSDLNEAGLQPDDVVLTHLLDGCRHLGNYKLGKVLFTQLVADGVKPSEYTLIMMLKLCGRCGEHNDACQFVESWERTSGMKPSVIHFTCLISGCLRSKSYSQAWKAYELMCMMGTEPDETALSKLIPGMAAARQWDRVLSLARRALNGPMKISLLDVLNDTLQQMQAAGGSSHHAVRLEAVMRGAAVPVSTCCAARRTTSQ